jgi:tetratricopeptide (TPR) repeat protein
LTNLFSSVDQLEKLEALFQERLGSEPLLPDVRYDPVNVARSAIPQFPGLYLELANECSANGLTVEAAACRRKATALIKELESQNADNHDLLLQLYLSGFQSSVKQSELEEAKAYRDKLLALKIRSADVLNEVAWTFATAAEPELRDGSNAVAFAELAVAATDRTNASILDTLAAARAEIGEFAKAINIQNEAIALVKEERSLQSGGYYRRLRLYEANQPYRQSVPPGTP